MVSVCLSFRGHGWLEEKVRICMALEWLALYLLGMYSVANTLLVIHSSLDVYPGALLQVPE